ncbi:MAG TPA: S-layer homology domain-containing protein, partial [Armatimonadetes bacterium]|nr:S-layer homology domain-containing protein [Armatimonadota bacterium]
MSKVGFWATVGLVVALAVPAMAGPFTDVPFQHWAYEAVNQLAEAGLLEGYPDGTFRGKENLTRYEFAMALSRLLDHIERLVEETVRRIAPPPAEVRVTDEQVRRVVQQIIEAAPERFRGPQGPPGPQGPQGPPGPQGPTGPQG